jgi:hypothetical protein
LNGFATQDSRKKECYLQSRIELYEYYKRRKALNILQSYRMTEYHYLGEGKEDVVFTDNQKVYKVYFSLSEQKFLNLKAAMPYLCNAIHLSDIEDIEDIVNFQDNFILIYLFEKSELIIKLIEEDFIGFLAEMWQRKLIAKNIKPENFVRINGIIKLIDYELEQYTDNLFLNMCMRAFIYIKYFGKDYSYISKLSRSAINNFDLPELAGVQKFVNKVFSTIIFKESQSVFQTLNSVGLTEIHLNDENWFDFTTVEQNCLAINPFRKTVSLIIKTCPQDYETIYANVKHIVKQLSTPDTFFEKIIAVDAKKKDFTRQYTNKGTLENLMQQVNRLIDEQMIDRHMVMHFDEISNVNERWFGISSTATHSVKGAPIVPQLYAFEQAKGEYIFQMDSDVMIARKDLSHSFLEDMVSEMERNEKVVSVGFNICQNYNIDFKPYFGFEDGGFVPEVRMGLFHKQHFLSLRPRPNSLLEQINGLYRSFVQCTKSKKKQVFVLFVGAILVHFLYTHKIIERQMQIF